MSLIIILALATVPGDVVAKGPVDEIEIIGPALSRAVEVTEGPELGEFNPWGQLFLGERVDAQPSVSQPATVTMYSKDESGRLEPLYKFSYYPDERGGFIYVPGRGDADYELNKGTIITQNDGKWFQASVRWEAFVSAASRVQPPATGDGGLR